ncbi:MAG: bifunctional glutamate N-acetyltransferase/amino-acid acetyltransferase ArgJ [Miltoncostaeaceae bacterium]
MSDGSAFPPIERTDWLGAPEALRLVEGGSVTTTPGFVAAGVSCGLKESGDLDLGLLAAEGPVVSALVDTRNALPAAAIVRNRRQPADGFRAVVVNSGSANAGTGERGVANSEAMAARAADGLGLEASRVAVSSTGTIGDQLRMDAIERGIDAALAERSPHDDGRFGRAICTTDAWPKGGAFRLSVEEGEIVIGAAAKGAGMISPGMATMLAYLTTDAPVDADALQRATARAAAASFNRISVDGQMSPSDTVLVLSTGRSAALSPASVVTFEAALTAIMRWLALQMVRDGEGADHAVRAVVSGARDDAEAERVARAVGNSPLVKTAVAGRDPNGGRVEQAVGHALLGAPEPIGGVSAAVDGVPLDAGRAKEAAEVMSRGEYDLAITLMRGAGEAEVWFSDLTHAYVSLNTDYRT